MILFQGTTRNLASFCALITVRKTAIVMRFFGCPCPAAIPFFDLISITFVHCQKFGQMGNYCRSVSSISWVFDIVENAMNEYIDIVRPFD